MTCIVGFKKNGHVYMTGDSSGSAGMDQVIRKDPKVFVTQNVVIGFCGSFRMGQILRNYIVMPDKAEGDTDFDYISTSFVEHVRQIFSDHGYMKKEGEQEEGGTFLVGYRGEIYIIDSDFQVGMHEDNFIAIGGGQSYAAGAMSILSDTVYDALTPEEILEKSLMVAERFSTVVRGPFRTAVLPPEEIY